MNEQTGLISIRGNGLAEHDQLSIVIREGPSCLLAGRNRLLVLCELGLELANVLLERARLLPFRREREQPEGHDRRKGGHRQPDRQLVAPHGADPAPGMNVFTASRPFWVF